MSKLPLDKAMRECDDESTISTANFDQETRKIAVMTVTSALLSFSFSLSLSISVLNYCQWEMFSVFFMINLRTFPFILADSIFTVHGQTNLRPVIIYSCYLLFFSLLLPTSIVYIGGFFFFIEGFLNNNVHQKKPYKIKLFQIK